MKKISLFKQSIYGIFDQFFSSLLIFGINYYFAAKSYLNEVGIFALVFASFGFAQVFQQALLERPFLIKKNIFKIKIILKRISIVIVVLFLSILYFYFVDTNSLPDSSLNPIFIIPWIILGIVHLLFILARVYFYSLNKEKIAFLMSATSTLSIFLLFLIGQNYIEKRVTIFMFLISIIKLICILIFSSQYEKIDKSRLTEDSSKVQYLNLILISLSIFLKSRFLIFYLANFAFVLAGLYEILRNILEIVLIPFRPISQTLLNRISENRNNFNLLPINYIIFFFTLSSTVSIIFYNLLSKIYSLYKISFIESDDINLNLTLIVFVSILIIPVNSSLLAYKYFVDELIVKIFPTIYLIIIVIFSSEIHDMSFFIKVICYSTILEGVLSFLLLSYRKYLLNKKNRFKM